MGLERSPQRLSIGERVSAGSVGGTVRPSVWRDADFVSRNGAKGGIEGVGGGGPRYSLRPIAATFRICFGVSGFANTAAPPIAPVKPMLFEV